ncbi:hypothetical protein ACEPAG_659 [Sanghuangporus baumii]
MNTPALLPPHVVSLLLSYLSRLDDPLPPHLISTPLRQRHQFLGLGQVLESTQDAAAYLSWPSSQGSEDASLRVVDLLRSLPSPENFDPLLAYPTKYSFDGEAVYAHAQVPLDGFISDSPNGLRLIFRWEARDGEGAVEGHQGVGTNTDNWKYHDAKPMPFPPNSHDSPQETLHPEAENSTPTQSHPPSGDRLPTSFRSQLHIEQSSDSDDDAYWDSYGRSSSDDEDEGMYNSHRSTVSETDDDDEKAEEAYWAQYASVHGTADSTRHSPLPQKRKLHGPSQPIAVRPSCDYSSDLDRHGSQEFPTSDELLSTTSEPYDTERIDYLHHLTTFRGRETSPDGVPCPEALSRRLHNLSPLVSLAPSPAPPEADADVLGLENVESPDVVSPDTSDTQTLTPPGDTQTNAIPELSLSASISPLVDKGRDGVVHSGVHEAIRGVYRLWAASRGVQPDTTVDKDEFLDLVRDTLRFV